jgi:hypothetical protein
MSEDNQIKLYSLLIDQLTKYNTIIWQVPIALFGANILVFDKASTKPYFVLAMIVFNASFIFAFYKMVAQQRAIIDAAREAERELKVISKGLVPDFKSSKLSAPFLFVWILSSLNIALLLYFFDIV